MNEGKQLKMCRPISRNQAQGRMTALRSYLRTLCNFPVNAFPY